MASFDSDKAAQIHRHLHSHLPSDPALRVKALESLVVERGLVASETIDSWIEAYSEDIGPKRGAKIVARAWLDADFRARLLDDAAGAVAEFGFEGSATGHLKAVENTAKNIMLPCVLYVLVIPFLFWVCRPVGTNRQNIAPEPYANRVLCWRSLGSRLGRMWRCGFGTVRQSCAIS